MKHNILLAAINAKYIHSNLAVYSLKKYAAEKGMEADIAEFTINQKLEDILWEIYEKHPSVLCFSCYIWNIGYVRELAEEFNKLCPDVPIWLGGPEVSYNVEEFFRENPAVAGIMMGEGEETFYRLCLYFEGKLELEKIQGISYRKKGTIAISPPAELLSMDKLPFCYENTKDFENRIIYYESSRGCPFFCSYCLSSLDRKVRLRSLSLVKRELGFFLENKVPQVKFIDRTFNCIHEHACGIWKHILENDNGTTNFHFEISADLLNEDEMNLLLTMRQGLVQLEIGVQSTNPETIREINRSMNLPKLKAAVKKIHEGNNIHQHLDLIAGLPFEDYESFKNSFDEVYSLKPQQLQLGFLKVLKGSCMYHKAEEYGLVYRTTPPYEVLSNKWISYEEIGKIKLVEKMLEMYYNSAQFRRSLTVLEKSFQSPFMMYLKLGEYHKEQGLLDKSLARLSRCRVILGFAGIYDKDRLLLYKEALTYDLYLRENAGKRPEWSEDQKPFKKQVNEILKERGYEKKYCHMERFYYPVYGIDILEEPGRPLNIRPLDIPKWVLFDYENKNSWNLEADVVVIN